MFLGRNCFGPFSILGCGTARSYPVQMILIQILGVKSAAKRPFGRKIKSPQVFPFGSSVGCTDGARIFLDIKFTPSTVG